MQPAAPTPAQAAAGNYRKGRLRLCGLRIAIETPKGAVRRGVGPDGTPWECTMPGDYGDIGGTRGADGDPIDVTVGPFGTQGERHLVYVVDQLGEDGAFDEHKCFLGYATQAEAVEAYDASFSDGRGPERRGAVTSLPFIAFRAWVRSGDTRKPLAWRPELTQRQDAPAPAVEAATLGSTAQAQVSELPAPFGVRMLTLGKREKGSPLSEAEIQQRRDAAKARWRDAGATAVGAAAGAGLGTLAARRLADRKGAEAPTPDRVRRLRLAWLDRQEDRITAARAAKERLIRRPFTRPAESEKPGRPLSPVSLRVRQVRGAIAPTEARRGALQDRLRQLDTAWERGESLPGPGEAQVRRELASLPSTAVQQAEIERLKAAKPRRYAQVGEAEVTRRTESWGMRRRIKREGMPDTVKHSQALGLTGFSWQRKGGRRKVPSTIPDGEMRNIRYALRGKADMVESAARDRAARNAPKQNARLAAGLAERTRRMVMGRVGLRYAAAAGAAGAAAGYLGSQMGKADEPGVLSKAAPTPSKADEATLAQRIAAVFRDWYENPQAIDPAKLRDATVPTADLFLRGAASSGIYADTDRENPRRFVDVAFDRRNPRVEEAATRHHITLVGEITQTQQRAIQAAITEQARLGMSPQEAARRVRDSIGLTETQAHHVATFRTQLRTGDPRVLNRALRDRRFDKSIERALAEKRPLKDEQVERMVDAYHRRYLAYRATTIARTEGVRAANTGSVEGIRAQLDAFPDLTVVKTWQATDDERTRDDHVGLDGRQAVGIDSHFVCRSGDTIRYPHDPLAPARQTINCRCTVKWTLVPRATAPRLVAEGV